MFQTILRWIREAWQKMFGVNNVKQALNVDISISPEMVDKLQLWSQMYLNQSPWLVGDMQSLNLAASIAKELATTVTIEMEVKVTGSARGDFLQAQLDPTVNAMRRYAEYAIAKGGLILKPYIYRDGLTVDYVQADQFYPINFDANGKMTAAVFADQKVIGGAYYTRLESHTFLPDGNYQIYNTAWRSSSLDVLGNQIPLSSVADWAELEETAIIQDIDRPLFAYFKMPFANNINTSSPLGVSIYSRATDLIKQADQQWTDFLWEFESGRRALYTDPQAFKKDTKTGNPILPDKRLYRVLDLVGKIDKQGLFEDWTPTIREINILNGLDAILRRIEFACGLSYGVLSNPEAIQLTATEIKAGKQRYYATVTDTQKALEDALEDLLYAMDVWTTLGNLAPRGNYTATYSWDDSIVADHDTQFIQDQQSVSQNTMPKYVFNIRNYGLDEETAKRWVQEAQGETPNTGSYFPSGA